MAIELEMVSFPSQNGDLISIGIYVKLLDGIPSGDQTWLAGKKTELNGSS